MKNRKITPSKAPLEFPFSFFSSPLGRPGGALGLIISLIKHRAKKEQYYLEIGAYFLKKGAVYKPGDPFMVPIKNRGVVTKKRVWIANLYYDFGNNKITHQFTNKNPNAKKR